MSKVKVVVDPGLCIAAASCMGEAPAFFKMDDDNIAVVVGPGGEAYTQILEVTAAQRASLKEAAGACPTTAISVEDVA